MSNDSMETLVDGAVTKIDMCHTEVPSCCAESFIIQTTLRKIWTTEKHHQMWCLSIRGMDVPSQKM